MGIISPQVPRFAFLVATMAAIGSGSDREPSYLRVVTSTADLASLAREVGGNRVEAISLAAGYEDPHFVPRSARELIKLKQADLFLVIGLQMEIVWLGDKLGVLSPLVQSQNGRIQYGSKGYFDLSPFVQVVEIPDVPTRAEGIHPLGNPHYWLDPENGRRMARAIATKLENMLPDDTKYFEQRFASFSLRLAQMERLWEKKMRPYRGYRVVTYHRAWGNFLKRFSLVSIGEIEPLPGVPPNDDHDEVLVREMKRQNAHVILIEPQYKGRSARKIAAATGAKILVLPGSVGGVAQATDYCSLLEYNIESLIKAFRNTTAHAAG